MQQVQFPLEANILPKLIYPSLQSNTKMTTLPTLCIYGKSRWCVNWGQFKDPLYSGCVITLLFGRFQVWITLLISTGFFCDWIQRSLLEKTQMAHSHCMGPVTVQTTIPGKWLKHNCHGLCYVQVILWTFLHTIS